MKFVQIAVCTRGTNDSDLFALDDVGRVWILSHDGDWARLPAHPEVEEAERKKHRAGDPDHAYPKIHPDCPICLGFEDDEDDENGGGR